MTIEDRFRIERAKIMDADGHYSGFSARWSALMALLIEYRQSRVRRNA